MSELEKATSTWARMRSKHAVSRMESTAPFTFSTPGIGIQHGRPAITRCFASGQQDLARVRRGESVPSPGPRKDFP